MALSLEDSLTIAPDVMFRHLNNEAVLLDLRAGTYFGLNDVGARAWQLIEVHGTLSRILDVLAEEYAVDRGELERDLLNLAEELVSRRLVRLANVGDDRIPRG